jgi:hypothetical protein
MSATAKPPRRSTAQTDDRALITDPAPAEHIPEAGARKSVSWTGRERLRCLWHRLRPTVPEITYATRRMFELQMSLPMTTATGPTRLS